MIELVKMIGFTATTLLVLMGLPLGMYFYTRHMDKKLEEKHGPGYIYPKPTRNA